MKDSKKAGTFLILILSVLFTGCGGFTPLEHEHNEIKELLSGGEFEQAYKRMNSDQTANLYGPQDSALRFLDLAIISFYSGRYAESYELFAKSRNITEKIIRNDAGGEAVSFFLNDNYSSYYSPAYEAIQADKFQIISLMSSGKFTEAIKKLEKHPLIEEEYDNWYSKIESSVMDSLQIKFPDISEINSVRAESAGEAKLIEFLREIAKEAADSRGKEKPDRIDPAENDSTLELSPEQVNVAFFAYSGLMPEKIETGARITSYDGYIIISGPSVGRTIILPSPFFTKGYNIKFYFPSLSERKSRADRVEIYADGVKVAEIDSAYDFSGAAINGFEQEKQFIYTKTALRAFLKSIGAAIITDGVSEAGGFWPGRIISILVNLLADASESADLRGGELLPAELYYSSLYFEPGIYDIEIRYYDADGDIIVNHSFNNAVVEPGSTKIINSFCLRDE